MSSPDGSGGIHRARGDSAVDRAMGAINGAATAGCALDRTLIVTTSARPNETLLAEAHGWAQRLGVPVVPRDQSLGKLTARHGVQGVLVVTPQRPVYREPEKGLEYFFHPAMAKTRLHNCRRGHDDPMLQAMGLQAGETVLDCTLGRGTDAMVAAWRVGPEGRVVGLEKSRLLAELTIHGLREYVDPSRELTALLRRLEAVCADYNAVLPALPEASFDVVYFDPIFDQPLEKSQAMSPLRALADASPLPPEALAQARRVARRCVIIKQRRGSALWAALGVTAVQSGPRSHVEYGVIGSTIRPNASNLHQ